MSLSILLLSKDIHFYFFVWKIEVVQTKRKEKNLFEQMLLCIWKNNTLTFTTGVKNDAIEIFYDILIFS